MNNRKNTTLVIRTSIALALALAIWSPVQARSAEPEGGKMKMGSKMMTDTNVMQSCQAMMEQREKMMAEIKTQDAKIAVQVAKMNSAPEKKKLDLMAAVVTEISEQRAATNASMEKMQNGMMQHMSQHMQMGQDSMSHCPMMKDTMDMKHMKGMKKNSGDAAKKQ